MKKLIILMCCIALNACTPLTPAQLAQMEAERAARAAFLRTPEGQAYLAQQQLRDQQALAELSASLNQQAMSMQQQNRQMMQIYQGYQQQLNTMPSLSVPKNTICHATPLGSSITHVNCR